MNNLRTKMMSLLGVALVAAVSQAQASYITMPFGDNASLTEEISPALLSGSASVYNLDTVAGKYQIQFGPSFSVSSNDPIPFFGASDDPLGAGSWLKFKADDGYVITSVTQTISGLATASVRNGAANKVTVAATALSVWASSGSSQPTDLKSDFEYTLSGSQGSDGEENPFSVSNTVTFANSRTVSLISMLALGGVFAEGQSNGSIAMSKYTLTITTAEATAVPEPENLALVLGGLGIVGFRLSRRAKA